MANRAERSSVNDPFARTTPVVILRSGHHGGLGIVRSLGRLGVPVFCVDADRWEPAFTSRYCRGRFLLKPDGDTGCDLLAQLLEIGGKIGSRPILIPTTDEGAIWTAAHSEALQQSFRFPLQSAVLVRSLSDKAKMQDLARQHGLPTAQSAVPASREDVLRFLETASFPVMIKATDAAKLRSRVGRTKFLAHSRDEVLGLYAKAEDQGVCHFLLQEFIPGEDWMFEGYFNQHSQCLFGVTGKKLRRFPVQTGVTSLGICLRNEEVEEMTTRFMQAIAYRGILDIGFRLDQRNGKYRIMDVNPRIGCTFRLFVAANGMDAARALYLDLTGQPVVWSAASEGRKWLVEDFDLISAFRCWRNRTLSLAEWLRSFRGIEEAACFALDDPLPFLLTPIANCCELNRWIRGLHAAKARPHSMDAQPDRTAKPW